MHAFAHDTARHRSPRPPKAAEAIRPPQPGSATAAGTHDLREFAIHPQHGRHLQAKRVTNAPGDACERQADDWSSQLANPSDLPPARLSPTRLEAASHSQMPVPATVDAVLAASGQPLDAATRQFMEPRLGHDLAKVRIHDDASAAESAAAISARAYTVGHHVVFGSGEYQPASSAGRRLLAHELVHVTQQNAVGALSGNLVQRDDTVPDPKIAALKAELVATYGLLAVTDSEDAQWTGPELEKMKRALARIPTAERAAIKGVELRRVSKTSEFSADAAGLFKQQMDSTSGQRQDRIEIASEAFDLDTDYDAGGSHTEFGGQRVAGSPSENILSHEVGHAVEALPQRLAEEKRVQKDNADTTAFESLQTATANYNKAILTSLSTPGTANAREAAYQTAILDAQAKLGELTKKLSSLPENPTAADSAAAGSKLKLALPAARSAIAKRIAAGKALPAGSTYADADAETAQDAWLAAAEALLAPLDARAATQKETETATAAEAATMLTIKVSSGNKVEMTLRLAEFVAVIESNGIKISGTGLGSHVDSHWPDEPAEAYAELYGLSLTAPDGLKKFDAKGELASYFTSPVGPKGAQVGKVKKWLAANQ
ncbi:MAG: hypothetical protein H6R14_1079 [Proteobacteria bacterium]|nr:hypothetical protein [Pseudomonadota bacterium]